MATRLGELAMPALALWDADDAWVPVEIAQALAAGLPQAKFKIPAQCGHPPTLEKPTECAIFLREPLTQS